MDDIKINLIKNEYKKEAKHPSYTNKKITISQDIPAGVYEGAMWGGKTEKGTPMVSLKLSKPQQQPVRSDDNDDIPF